MSTMSLSPIQKLRYKRVDHSSLPAKPENRKEFVYTGGGFHGKPFLLEEYIKGGMSFSEKRRNEVKAKYFARTLVRNIFGLLRPKVKNVFILSET